MVTCLNHTFIVATVFVDVDDDDDDDDDCAIVIRVSIVIDAGHTSDMCRRTTPAEKDVIG